MCVNLLCTELALLINMCELLLKFLTEGGIKTTNIKC